MLLMTIFDGADGDAGCPLGISFWGTMRVARIGVTLTGFWGSRILLEPVTIVTLPVVVMTLGLGARGLVSCA